MEECSECEKQRKDRKVRIRKMSAINDMDPFPNGYPTDLPELTEIEEMLIARVHVVMKSYRLENGGQGFKGNVLNMEQTHRRC